MSLHPPPRDNPDTQHDTERSPTIPPAIRRVPPTVVSSASPIEEAVTIAFTDADGPAVGEIPAVPGYEILAELGRGGMGVVYQARQTKLNRLVALKMVLHGNHASTADLDRFLAEGEAVAQLQHANIVQIYEIGQHSGLPFFSLEYVEGGTLAQRLQRGPLPPREAAQLTETLARAMAYAHGRGLIHRDLKPSNVLLAADGTPKIADFGLAKRVEGGSSNMTATGAIVGTPNYMAPEQAGAKKDISALCDVYALGAMLYEMLTGRPPFAAPTPIDTVFRVLTEEPVPPRRLQPKLPRDLETICLKCLQKESHKRYGSAHELADDLGRFHEDRPIVARPVSRPERVWRWCRRNPVIASLAAALMAGAVVALYFLNAERTKTLSNLERALEAESHLKEQEGHLKEQLQKTRDAEQEKTDKLWQSYFDQARAGFFSRQLGQRIDGLKSLAAAARIRPADQLRDQTIACMALIDLRTVPSGITLPEGATSLAIDPSGKLYAYADKTDAVSVRRLSDSSEVAHRDPEGKHVAWLSFAPDGRWLAEAWDGAISIWNVETGETPIKLSHNPDGADFSPDSRRLALSWDGNAHVFDLPSGAERRVFSTGLGFSRLVFSPDGRRLAADNPWNSPVVRIFDTETGDLSQELTLPQTNTASPPHWHADGERLAVGAVNNRAYIFHVPDRRILTILEGHAQDVTDVNFTSDGDHLLTSSWDGTTRLWEVATGHQLLVRPGPLIKEVRRNGPHLGHLIDRNNSVQFVELAGGPEYRTLATELGAGQGAWRCMTYSPDGRFIAAGFDEGVFLWDAQSGRQVGRVPALQCGTVAFSADGRALITCSSGMGMQRWPLDPDPADADGLLVGRPRMLPLPVVPSNFQLSADGEFAAVAGLQPRAVVLLDLAAEKVRPFRMDHPNLSGVAISPNGRLAASNGWHSENQYVWDTRTGDKVKEFTLGKTTATYFTPDSRWLITSHAAEYRFWDVETWEPGVRIARDQEPYPGPVAFTRDGEMMAVELTPGTVSLMDWKHNRTLARLEDPSHDRVGLCFSPDGTQLLALASYDKALHVWDLRRIRAELKEIGLDWDAPDYPPAPPPPGAVRIKIIDGQPGKPAPPREPPLIVLRASGAKRRSATPEQIAGWIKQLADKDTKTQDEAEKALEEVGAPALPALGQTVAHVDAGVRQRVERLLDRIAVADALTPRRVSLKVKGAPPEDVLKELSDKTGIRAVYVPRPGTTKPLNNVTLDLDNVPVLQALDRVGQAAGLIPYPQGANGWELRAGKFPVSPSILYNGPYRLRATGFQYSPPGPAGVQLLLHLSLGSEGEAANAARGRLRLAEAVDDTGRDLRIDAPDGPPLDENVPGPVGTPSQTFRLQSPAKRGGRLKKLKIVLPVEVTARRDILTASYVPQSGVKTFDGGDGIRFTVEGVTTFSINSVLNSIEVQFTVSVPEGRDFDPKSLGLRWTDAKGKVHHTPDITMDSTPQMVSGKRRQWSGSASFHTPEVLGSSVQLTWFRNQRLRSEVPFEFHDLPLP